MRTGYKTKPYEKSMEVFQDFSGGLNTTSPPDNMLDNELIDILNVDISERGSLKRRYGLRKLRDIPFSGQVQGYFRYYRTDGTYDEFVVREGYIYRNDETTIMEISGGVWQFQTTKPVEAVQFGDKLYIATGSKLITYDGTSLNYIDPYLPNTMEMTYIGSNALADNPEGHIVDSTGTVASIDYVLPKIQRDFTKMWISARVYGTKVSGETYEYAIQVRGSASKDNAWPAIDSGQWVSLNPTGNWLGADASQRLTVYKYGKIASTGSYEVKISMRNAGTTTVISECTVPYTVSDVVATPTINTNTIHSCNRIILHWGRLMLYGDSNNPTAMYMSHLNTPNYFPALMNIEFENPRREPLTSIIHYRNSLVVFTRSSIQALYGTGPDDYRRTMLHTDLGCISPYGAAVMKNAIGFISAQGVFSLKTLALTDDKATVEKLDLKISNILPLDTNAIAVYEDSQFKLTFPSQKTRFRYYYELKAWTKDYSDKFDFVSMVNIDGVTYCVNQAALYVFDETIFDDDNYNYENHWESKYLSFGQPYHPKKLKELQVLTAPKDDSMNCTVYVYADEEAVITPDSSYASVVDGAVVWNTVIKSNFHVSPGIKFDNNWVMDDAVFGNQVYAKEKLSLNGKCLRTRIKVSNTEPKENHFIGFAFIFKTRKP